MVTLYVGVLGLRLKDLCVSAAGLEGGAGQSHVCSSARCGCIFYTKSGQDYMLAHSEFLKLIRLQRQLSPEWVVLSCLLTTTQTLPTYQSP